VVHHAAQGRHPADRRKTALGHWMTAARSGPSQIRPSQPQATIVRPSMSSPDATTSTTNHRAIAPPLARHHHSMTSTRTIHYRERGERACLRRCRSGFARQRAMVAARRWEEGARDLCSAVRVSPGSLAGATREVTWERLPETVLSTSFPCSY
jgi:hypothetical protein